MGKTKSLCFFTQSYPYGNSETYVENELNYIAPHFDVVYLFHKSRTGKMREIPTNVRLIYIDPPSSFSKKEILKKDAFLLVYLVFHELLFSRQRTFFLKKIKYNIHHILNCIYYSDKIQQELSTEVLKNSPFYSYWFFDWNFSLSVLKKKKLITRLYTRAHGFDVYEYHGKQNYLPSRKFCLMHTDKVFTVSGKGESYLKWKYPEFSDKIFKSYLGTKDFGENPLPRSLRAHIVSCSNVVDVKRVHLIVEVLNCITFPALWTHIGDGPLLDEVKEKSKDLPANVEARFTGSLTQKDIFDFYSTVPVTVFINCSASEGLPVSIMESISFGIPVIATDVGGTNEIVNDATGILINRDFDPNYVAECILKIRDKENIQECRKAVKTFWRDNFYAARNYGKFLQNLI